MSPESASEPDSDAESSSESSADCLVGLGACAHQALAMTAYLTIRLRFDCAWAQICKSSKYKQERSTLPQAQPPVKHARGRLRNAVQLVRTIWLCQACEALVPVVAVNVTSRLHPGPYRPASSLKHITSAWQLRHDAHTRQTSLRALMLLREMNLMPRRQTGTQGAIASCD